MVFRGTLCYGDLKLSKEGLGQHDAATWRWVHWRRRTQHTCITWLATNGTSSSCGTLNADFPESVCTGAFCFTNFSRSPSWLIYSASVFACSVLLRFAGERDFCVFVAIKIPRDAELRCVTSTSASQCFRRWCWYRCSRLWKRLFRLFQ